MRDLLSKLHFVWLYVAPWQLAWGSAVHAIAQPFAFPHAGLLLFQVFLGALLQAPLLPLLGSAIFLLGYSRNLKFWEKDYKYYRFSASNEFNFLAEQICNLEDLFG